MKIKIIILLVLFPAVSWSGTTALYLRTAISVRQAAMSGVSAVSAEGIDPVFSNPAGLACVDNAMAAFQHFEFVQGIRHEILSAGMPFIYGGIAAAFDYISVGALENRDQSGIMNGYFRPFNVFGQVSCGQLLAGQLMAGISAKIYYESVTDYSHAGVAFDIGCIWTPVDWVRTGLLIRNFGPATAAGEMPLETVAGAAFLFGKITSTIDISIPNRQTAGFNFGAEYKPFDVFALRTGYRWRPTGDSLGGLAGFSSGAGFFVGNFIIDYAFIHYGWMGLTHTVSLTVKL